MYLLFNIAMLNIVGNDIDWQTITIEVSTLGVSTLGVWDNSFPLAERFNIAKENKVIELKLARTIHNKSNNIKGSTYQS